jgi:hypothetical protein
MSESDMRNPVQATERQPWQPLGYDKISAAEAEAGFTGVGGDGGFYS